MATRAAEEGVRAIFCEKAIACSMQEADAILKAVQENNTLFNSGVLRRFDLCYHQARDMIRQGEIGEPQAAVHYARTNLLHGHIHSIDTLSFLLDDPKVESIWGELNSIDHRIPDNRLDDDPYGIFQLTFANGVAAASVPAGHWEFEVIGDRGSVRVLNNGEGLQLRKGQADNPRIMTEVAVEPAPEYSATQYCLEDLILAHEEGRPTLGLDRDRPSPDRGLPGSGGKPSAGAARHPADGESLALHLPSLRRRQDLYTGPFPLWLNLGARASTQRLRRGRVLQLEKNNAETENR